VDVADSAIAGLMLCHASYYDVLIVDVLMPGTTGLNFVEQLRRTRRDVVVIMISGGRREKL
jgi:YesN/AraC family two-component response regulator